MLLCQRPEHGHGRSCPPVASVSMAARITTARSTGLAERFEVRLKEIANQDNETIMNTTRWGDKLYMWDRPSPPPGAELAAQRVIP